MLKKLTILGLLIVGFIGAKAIISSLDEPATGVVGQEPVVVVLTPTTTITDTTVPTEEEMDGDVEEVEPIVVTEPVVVFKPLTFTKGSLKKFAKENGTVVITLMPQVVKYLKTLGVETNKGVKINGDLYIKVGSNRYVIHTGELIKL